MPALNYGAPEPDEGWSSRIRAGDTTVHYYRHEMSICPDRKIRLSRFTGPLEPDDMPGPDDCPDCRGVLDREAMEQGFPDQETEALMEEDSRKEREV